MGGDGVLGVLSNDSLSGHVSTVMIPPPKIQGLIDSSLEQMVLETIPCTVLFRSRGGQAFLSSLSSFRCFLFRHWFSFMVSSLNSPELSQWACYLFSSGTLTDTANQRSNMKHVLISWLIITTVRETLLYARYSNIYLILTITLDGKYYCFYRLVNQGCE